MMRCSIYRKARPEAGLAKNVALEDGAGGCTALDREAVDNNANMDSWSTEFAEATGCISAVGGVSFSNR
jgi:hypothetical protein